MGRKLQPILGVFYALGFSTGNVVGIILERRIAFGHIILRIISTESGKEMKPFVPLDFKEHPSLFWP